LLPQWSWNPFDDQWNEGLEYLKKYVAKENHAKVPLRFKYENFNLGKWVSHRRTDKEKLDLEKIQQLESLPQWSWNVLDEQWNEGFEYLNKYIQEFGNAKIPRRLKYENYSLGEWCSTQRKSKNRLNSERIKLLESLPQWSWDVIEDQWSEGFEYLKKYIEEYGHAKVPARLKYDGFELGTWVSNRRSNRNMLDLEKIQKLEALPSWVWRVKS
jgi:hypothetical protein